jgi:eukaryotic-like serine/threonine-protein kinase
LSRPDVLVADRYRLVEQIASGGMGSVWEAWDERLQRRVALKQLHPQPGLSPAEAKLAGDRAMREARITARLHHPHAVPVYDVVDFDGQPCLIMQYLPSKSLQALIKERGTISPAEVARIGGQVAEALAAAHQVGIVHRDVKPANVLIDHDGEAKITDFGISHAIDDVALTSTGMVTGTPAFLAPEVARGVESGPAADVFSLGSTLYAALEGNPPFGTEENPMAMLHRVASGQIIPPQRSGPMTDTLLQMLAVDPATRPSMKEVGDKLVAVRAAILDPAAGGPTHRIDPTRRMAPPPAPVEPPTTTVTLPAVDPARARAARPAAAPLIVGGEGAPPERPKRRLTAVAVAAAVLVLGIAAVLATQLLGDDSNGGNAAGSPSSSTVKSSSSSRPAPRTTDAKTTEEDSSTPPPNTPTPRKSTSAVGNQPTSAQMTGAVRDYYALLPDDTDAAWNRLTPEYQAQTGGRDAFENFWKGFRSVNTSNIRVDGDTVFADLRYVSKNGGVSTETRSFRLVRQDGVLKIAESTA